VSLELVLDPAGTGAEGEVLVRVMLINSGEEPVMVNRRLAVTCTTGMGELTFEITSPSGETVPCGARVNVGSPEPEDFGVLPGWGILGRLHDLGIYFDLGDPGRYEVGCTYVNEATDGGAWVGRLAAPPRSVEIAGT
jgi:hypothetical protein